MNRFQLKNNEQKSEKYKKMNNKERISKFYKK